MTIKLITPSTDELTALLKPLAAEHFDYMRAYFEAMCLQGHPPTMFRLLRGVGCEAAPLPKSIRMGQKRECFKNAGELAVNDDRFTYFEGYALSSVGFPLEHAWVVGPEGKVIDNTWDEPEACVYFGIPFDTEFLTNRLLTTQRWGIFGDWTAAELMQTPLESMVAEPWREELARRPPCRALDEALALIA